MPVITIDTGGPGYVINQSCGIRVPAIDPHQLAEDLAEALTRLARDPALVAQLSLGASERVARIGLWENKAQWLLKLYSQVLDTTHIHKLTEAI